MIEPYQAIGLVPTMRGIRHRDEIARQHRAHHAPDQGGVVAVQHGPAGAADRHPGRRPAGLQRRGPRPRPRDVRAGVRDRHPGPGDGRPGRAGPAVERVRDGTGQGPPPRVPRALLQRRLRAQPGRRDHPAASQGGAAAAGRALGDPAQRVGQMDRAVRPQPGRVLPGGRHRDRPARVPDGQRGLVPGERPRPGHERRRGGLPGPVSRTRTSATACSRCRTGPGPWTTTST